MAVATTVQPKTEQLFHALDAVLEQVQRQPRQREPFKGFIELDSPAVDLILLTEPEHYLEASGNIDVLLLATQRALETRIAREGLSLSRPASMMTLEFECLDRRRRAQMLSRTSKTYIAWDERTGTPSKYFRLCEDEHSDYRWNEASRLLKK